MLQCIDNGASDRFAQLFTPEGKVEIPRAGVVKEGTAELAELCGFLHEKFKGCTHWEANVVLKKEPGNCNVIHNQSYWKALRDGECVSTGAHTDMFVRGSEFTHDQDGECLDDGVRVVWRCASRVITHTWAKPD